jgi:hypothetical protein
MGNLPMSSPHLFSRLARADLRAAILRRVLDDDEERLLIQVVWFVADVMVGVVWILGAHSIFGESSAGQCLQWLILVLFTTARSRVLLSFLYQPLLVAGHRIFLLETTVGRFTSAHRPTIFDLSGCVVGLTGEIGLDSIVRVHGEDRTMHAVQIVELQVVNPFQDT